MPPYIPPCSHIEKLKIYIPICAFCKKARGKYIVFTFLLHPSMAIFDSTELTPVSILLYEQMTTALQNLDTMITFL